MYCKKEAGKANYTNDAMATLGDAVLDLVWSEYFFAAGLDKDEITARKTHLVNNTTLKQLRDAERIQDDAYNDDFFADEAPSHRKLPQPDHDFYMEAIIAAIYLDLGLEAARAWILAFFEKHAARICYTPCKNTPKRV
jgi:dsRNA-specific ribonuclease